MKQSCFPPNPKGWNINFKPSSIRFIAISDSTASLELKHCPTIKEKRYGRDPDRTRLLQQTHHRRILTSRTALRHHILKCRNDACFKSSTSQGAVPISSSFHSLTILLLVVALVQYLPSRVLTSSFIILDTRRFLLFRGATSFASS